MKGFYVFWALNLFLFLSTLNRVRSQSKSGVYIVYMGASSPSTVNREHAQLLSELVKRKKNSILHTYHKSFLGFAARLSDEEAKSIARRSGVVSVFPDSVSKLHTTHSWDFIMSQNTFKNNIASASISTSSHSNVSNCSTGHDTIIGFIDSGIWPQHPSFNDKCMGPIPGHWKGICMTGNNSNSFRCNRKVIGARYYADPDDPDAITTSMDDQGHGTHVASTAAGMPVYKASYYGLAEGVSRGGSPSSRIASYRVCGPYVGCADSSILKAFDDAISDGVHVISLSMGGPVYENFITDAINIGAFHAAENGVIVVGSGGNEGPSPETICNYSPWFFTVAATSMDREYQVGILLGSGNDVIKGRGITFPVLNKTAIYPIVEGRLVGYNKYDLTNATYCNAGSLDSDKVKGKIVLCMNDNTIKIYDKIDAMIEQGVIGIIVIENHMSKLTEDNYQIPFAAISKVDGAQIQSYIMSTRKPLATILPTEMLMNYKPAPIVPLFSSRGPAPGIKNLIKPDVAAPGLCILAAWRFNDTSVAYPGKEPPLFNILTGTSMSAPHVSGLAALVKYWHPTWTPSAIRSSIMTTAIPTNNDNSAIKTITGSRATPYDIGSGEISLFNPLCPGLIYETEKIDYIIFLCNMGYNTSMIKRMSTTLPRNYVCPRYSSPDLISNLNYPSIAISGLMKNVKKTVKRTLTNVGKDYSTYTVTVEPPTGVDVQVVPNKLRFTKNVKKLSFQVTFTLTTTSLSEDDFFGSITWSDNCHKVRSPFVASSA